MKWNAQGEEVADDDPTGIYDEKPVTPAAPPANPAPANPDPSVLAAYEIQLRQEASERARLQRENEELRSQRATPPRSAEDTAAEERQFFDEPKKSTRTIVAEEVAKAVAPINNFTKQFANQQAYASLKQQMKDSGRFPHLAKIETIFDQAMNGVEPSVQSMTSAYQMSLGVFVSNGGSLTDSAPSDPAPASSTPAPVAPVKPLPPHARPSAPAAPSKPNGTTKVRALTENEKIIKRHNGYKHDAQYLFWTEHVSPNEVHKITPEEEKKRIKEIFGVDI